MANTFLGGFPKPSSSDLSGLLSEGILRSEKNKVKAFLGKFYLDTPHGIEALKEELRSMSLTTRLASMKSLVAMFDPSSDQFGAVKGVLDLATKLMADMAKLPSEVKEGLSLVKQSAGILHGINMRPSCDVGETLTEMAEPLSVFLKKLKVFEMSEAKIAHEKKEAVKFLGDMMVLYNVGGERAEKIRASMKSIEGIPSLTEEEEETLVGKGRQLMNSAAFGFKWNHVPDSKYRSLIDVDVPGDAICYVELAAHYLNLRTISGGIDLAELKADLFGEEKTGGNGVVMLKFLLESRDAHLVVKGNVEIRSSSERLCDFARDKVCMLTQKPELMKLDF